MGISTTHLNLTKVSEFKWFFSRGDSRCSTTTWRVKVLHVKDLQWFVTKTLAAKRDKMWMWWGASAEKSVLKKTRDKKKLVVKSLTSVFFLVLFLKWSFFFRDDVGILLKIFWWKTVDGQNPRKSMDMANIWYSQRFIRLIWSTGFCPQLVAASQEKWFSTWRIIPFYKCFINMISKFTNGGYYLLTKWESSK